MVVEMVDDQTPGSKKDLGDTPNFNCNAADQEHHSDDEQ